MEAFWKFAREEWYFFLPMLFMSLAGFTLIIWRILLNLGARTNMNEFLPAFQDKLEKEGVGGAMDLCRRGKGLIPTQLYVAGLETSKQGLAAMRRAMASKIELDILPRLNFLLALILAIAKIATMVGLLGTVISMINTFNKIGLAAQAGNQQNVAGHAGSIGLALFATMMGLATAIPLVFAHVLFKDWINKFELKMKSAAQNLLLLMQSSKVAQAPGTPAAPSKAPVASK